MDLNELKEGLKLVVDNDLSKRECKAYYFLLMKKLTCEELATKMGLSVSNTHNILFNLRNKALVCFQDKNSSGKVLYGLI